MKYIPKAVFFLQIIIYSPLILFILIIWPLLRIRIGVINSRSLGHLALSEIYLCDKKFGLYKRNEIVLWYHHREIANKYLLNQRKKQLIFLPGILLYPIRLFFLKYKFTHKHVYYKIEYDEHNKTKKIIHEKLYTNQEFLKQSDPFIKFSKYEIEMGDDFLKKNFINNTDKIIVFGSRSQVFRNEKFVSVRNSNMKKQIDAIKFVTDYGYKAIRVGRDRVDKFEINTKNFFDYTFSDHKKDFLDVYLQSKAKFMVSGNTGLNEIATIMRVPRLIVDFSNFNLLYIFNEAYTPMILPKKLYSKELKKNITYKEIFQKKFFNINVVSEIPNELQLIDNDNQEILNATKEMIELLENKLDFNAERNKQNNFWSMYSKFYGQKDGVIISPSFFKANLDLFY